MPRTATQDQAIGRATMTAMSSTATLDSFAPPAAAGSSNSQAVSDRHFSPNAAQAEALAAVAALAMSKPREAGPSKAVAGTLIALGLLLASMLLLAVLVSI